MEICFLGTGAPYPDPLRGSSAILVDIGSARILLDCGRACVQQMARLIGSHEADTLAFVSKAKWLEPEELYYLGFHFVEKERAEKKFGGEMLRLVVKRSPRSKLAKDAKSKLRGEGLE